MVQPVAHIFFLYQAEVYGRLLYGFLAQANVYHLPFADQLGVVGDEEAEAWELYGECEGGVHGVAVDDMGVPVAEHARGEVDGHYGGLLVVHVLHEHFEAPFQLFAKTGSEQAVDHQIVGMELRHVERFGDFVEEHLGVFGEKPVALCGTVGREFVAADVEEVHFGPESVFAKQPACGKCVGTVVSGACKYDSGLVGAPACADLVGDPFGHTLYQFRQRYTLLFDGVSLYRPYFVIGE